jgi:hypothetical protein
MFWIGTCSEVHRKCLDIRMAMAMIFLILGCSVVSGQNASKDSPPSVEDIIDGIVASRQSVTSLRITISRELLSENGQDLASPFHLGEVEFAFQGDKRFMRVKRVNRGSVFVSRESSKLEEVPIHEAIERGLAQPTTEERRVLNDDGFASIRGGVAELHTLTSVRKTESSNFDSFYLRCVGFVIRDPTATDDFESMREDTSLPGLLRSHTMTFETSFDELDGFSCVRIHGIDQDGSARTLWLSPSHGYMAVQRDDTGPDSQFLSRTRATDPVEVVDGFWLPRTCTYSYEYDGPGPDSHPGHKDEMRLVEWQVGDFDDSLFETKVSKSAAVVQHGRSANPVVSFPPVGGRKLDESIESFRRPSWLIWGNVGGVILLAAALLIGCVIRSRRRREE